MAPLPASPSCATISSPCSSIPDVRGASSRSRPPGRRGVRAAAGAWPVLAAVLGVRDGRLLAELRRIVGDLIGKILVGLWITGERGELGTDVVRLAVVTVLGTLATAVLAMRRPVLAAALVAPAAPASAPRTAPSPSPPRSAGSSGSSPTSSPPSCRSKPDSTFTTVRSAVRSGTTWTADRSTAKLAPCIRSLAWTVIPRRTGAPCP